MWMPADIGSGSFAGARDVRPPLPYAVHGHVPLRGILTYHHDAASVQARADRTSASHARRTFPDELREMPTGGRVLSGVIIMGAHFAVPSVDALFRIVHGRATEVQVLPHSARGTVDEIATAGPSCGLSGQPFVPGQGRDAMLRSMHILRIQVHVWLSSAILSASGPTRILKRSHIAPVRGPSARREHTTCCE